MKPNVCKLRVPDQIVELLRGMHPHLKKKIKKALQTIITDPYAGKFLKNELEGLRSYRISRFRIIYRISKKQVIDIIAIGPRNSIYEETFRVISREKRQS